MIPRQPQPSAEEEAHRPGDAAAAKSASHPQSATSDNGPALEKDAPDVKTEVEIDRTALYLRGPTAFTA